MIHVLLRVIVWVAVFGIAYLLFGPQLFDSSGGMSPFQSSSQIFLPAAKSQREIEYENLLGQRGLSPEESADYRSLVRDRESRFWQQEGVSVEEALSGVKVKRKQHLAEILANRGLSRDESGVFIMIVERDHPTLLADQE